MNNNIQKILLPAGRPLDAVEQYYRDLFIQHMTNSFNYIPEKGETIGQWLCTADDYRYYNPKKFQSSEGFCFTVSKKGIKINRPLVSMSRKSLKKENIDRWTEYMKENVPKWKKKYENGQHPLGYYYKNSYPFYAHLATKNGYNVPMHTVTLLYASPESEWDRIASAGAVHHIIPMDWDNPPYISNYAKNLQAIQTKATHTKMHAESKKLKNGNWKQEVEEKTKDFSKTIIAGDLTDIFESLLGGTHLDGYVSVHNEDGSIAMLQHFDDVSHAVGSAES